VLLPPLANLQLSHLQVRTQVPLLGQAPPAPPAPLAPLAPLLAQVLLLEQRATKAPLLTKQPAQAPLLAQRKSSGREKVLMTCEVDRHCSPTETSYVSRRCLLHERRSFVKLKLSE